MFKWFTQLIETKKRDETSSSASARSVLQRAVADAEQIVASVKERAKAEAEEGATKIIARAAEEVKEMKRKIEAVAERELGETGLAATGEVETNGVELKPEPIPEAGEEVIKIEELVQLPGEVTEEEVAEATMPWEETAVPEPLAVTVEESLKKSVLKERPSGEETEPELSEKDLKAPYIGEVELAILKPVNPKVVSKLYNYLQVTPEIKFVHTSGSWDRGTSIKITVDKPIPLVSALSSRIPEAKVMPELPEKKIVAGEKGGVKRIRIALREV
ncbi:MAG TPA: hypothetical protein VMW00_02405 [Dehalococcoidales bacterium]|nr:hypothetical protein [Dehalococcoidales bacterium]